MPVSTHEEFLAVLRRSRLFTSSQLAQAREFMLRPENPSVLKTAQWLVKQHWATVWQAERLLAGNRSFFLGNYKFLEPIGEGAMGVVFKCEHALMGRTVAVKVLSKARLSHPNALARFRREVQAVAALNHPNIVTAFDAGQAGATHYLVMEYIDGVDLNAWMQEYDCIKIPWACDFIRQTALGLHHAHQAGLVHRDIKPANILVAWNDDEQRPIVKILDLGLARALNTRQEEFEPDADETSFTLRGEESSQLTHEGVILGTPDYLAPEQILHNEDVDARADIFSLGCTLFKLITTHLPYSGPNLMGKLQARVDPHAPPAVKLRTYLPDADPSLELVLAKMLRRDPKQRYQSAAEVAEVLAAFAKPPTEKWDPLQLLRAAETDSSEVGSSQMEFDPRLRDFLGALGDEGGDGGAAQPAGETALSDIDTRSSGASDSTGSMQSGRTSMAAAARHRRQHNRARPSPPCFAPWRLG